MLVFRTDGICHVSFVDLTYELTLKSFELTGKDSSPDVVASCFLCKLFPLVTCLGSLLQ